MMRVSFMAGAAISTAASGLSYCAPSTMSAQWIRSATGAVSKPKLRGRDVRQKAGAGGVGGIEELARGANRVALAGAGNLRGPAA